MCARRAGQHPPLRLHVLESPYEVNNPATEDDNALIKTHGDALVQVFVEVVADNSGVTGAVAVSAGMADAHGTCKSFLVDLVACRQV
ncbi:hypothetical protein MKK84_00395 [Methylobacterium sp. E-065]|uniref:hypothetical protein n=1 Tax=Methylobacterium sp. E-065 TaxID=2836583 RepID=UPI001FB87048|nr:hypothetical protein [Methylobacterium sp. E-065]MCJ2015900.1 hypothetical protein [Methylobacterium sp. E-065]